jgi:hypothetical protein
MSGQRNKKPSDVIKARQEYLDNLSLQVQLNDANEQAVVQYKATGQVPPISQMKDTRTTSQILADVEKLKINLIKDLEPIADPQFAQLIIERLIQSPLNVDNGLLIFTAQRIDELVKNLKKLYKYGIKGDVNDAETFVSFINKFYTDKNKLSLGVKEYLNRIGTNDSQTSQATIQIETLKSIYAEFLVNYHALENLKSEIFGSSRNKRNYASMMNVANQVAQKMVLLASLLPPDKSYLSSLEELLIDITGADGYQRFSNDVSEYLDFINHSIPNLSYIQSLLIELSKTIDVSREIFSIEEYDSDVYISYMTKIKTVLSNIDSILNLDMRDVARMQATKKNIDRYSRDIETVRRTQEEVEEEEGEEGEGKEEQVPGVNPALPYEYMQPMPRNPQAPIVEQGLPGTLIPKIIRRTMMTDMKAVPEPQYQDLSGEDIDVIKDALYGNIGMIEYNLDDAFLNIPDKERVKISKALNTLKQIYNAPGVDADELYRALQRSRKILPLMGDTIGNGISTRTSSNANGINAINASRNPTKSNKESFSNGYGFDIFDSKQTINPADYLMPKDKIKYRMVGKGLPRADYSQGIDPSPRYIKFGRYMINNKKLNDNVLSLRRSKGSTIATIPATKMTSELGGVIKKIVGGGVPSFDELNALTDAEKRYLFRVSQEADIYDKIKIPTPSKDEEEKDIHAFNVMKGEILAGNNSKELVSKFKALLNKLSKNNILPKSQVREILEELLELGY